ncbi:IucA/IucC family protein [Microbacterium sp. MYb72]|uniref:GNAT family N-acetyltransferase n=1 Tax=Microbacterium sp. MYb72 TaxID=1848693 RepID=UPI000CFDDAC4|nr:GNAT family N-acetyltransferase [Microbacterium sp. MYb72]PRB09622.1 IucA/IucC family protein [Microbacterium sp. MYb72]
MSVATDLDITLIPADPRRDAVVLQSWLSDPHSAFWGMTALDAAQVEEYLASVTTAPGQQAWLGLIDGAPAFYAETYDPARVLLTEVHVAAPGDLGMHVLISPPGAVTRHGLTDAVFAAVMTWCFDGLGATRVVVEPDVRNERIRAKNVRAGFQELGEVVVDEGGHLKAAMLSTCTREAFAASALTRLDREERA